MRTIKTRTILVIILYTVFAIAYVYKAIQLSPWIGADTYPIFPRTLGDLLLTYISPWSFYVGRTSINMGIPYLALVNQALFSLFGKYSEAALVIMWLLLAGLGLYMVSGLLTDKLPLRIISGIIYMVSLFTWNQSINSIYGMMGAYALTPWILYIIIMYILSIRRDMENSSIRISGILVKGFVIGASTGILMISTLSPITASLQYSSGFPCFFQLPS